MKDYLIYISLIVTVIVLAIVVLSPKDNNLGFRTGVQTQACTMNSTTEVTIGNEETTEILSAFSNRAWARIQQTYNATNTVFMAFDEGADATTASGLQLIHVGIGTSSPQFIDFGRSTDFPYVGAVDAITDLGTTTVLVSECRY